MLSGFLLGLMGSVGHCVGMCGPVVVLLSRGNGRAAVGRAVLTPYVVALHLGRVLMYATLGWAAGALGNFIGLALPGLRSFQGAVALATALFALYMAVALWGRAPSPEVYFARLTRWWSTMVRRATARGRADVQPPHPFFLGMLWGLLPCGLVITALLAASATGTPWGGAAVMLAFGLGTWPALVGMGWLAQRNPPGARTWPRHLAVAGVLLFAVQMALRGLAAWEWVGHLHVAGVALW